MEAEIAGEKTKKRKTKPRASAATRSRKTPTKANGKGNGSTIADILRSIQKGHSRGEKAAYIASAAGLAAVAASRQGRKILGRVGSYALPVLISVLQPRIEAIVRETIEKKLKRNEA